jgi:hypothetical protein
MHTREAEAHTLQPAIENLPDEKSQETAEIMRRFNQVFLRHDPSELKSLVVISYGEGSIGKALAVSPKSRALKWAICFGRFAIKQV